MARRIRVSYGRTVQNAPYESIRLDVSLEKDIEDGAVVKDEVDKTTNGLSQYVKAKINEILTNEK
jgi:hypothetical protein